MTDADLVYTLEMNIESIVENSELASMASSHFDKDSAKKMITELIDEIKAEINGTVFGSEVDEEE